MTQTAFPCAGRDCLLFQNGAASSAAPCLILPGGGEEREFAGQLAALLEETGKTFSLLLFPVEDWNRALSPWPAPPVFGKEGFSGEAGETLALLEGEVLPALESALRPACFCLGGYSLAGLFALWAGYESPRFWGVAAVSPSVWYPDWDRFIAGHSMQARQVYLSLGDKEARTRSQTMAAVADRITLQQETLLSQGTRSVLEWNPGNHFREPERRVAKGFSHLLTQGEQL